MLAVNSTDASLVDGRPVDQRVSATHRSTTSHRPPSTSTRPLTYPTHARQRPGEAGAGPREAVAELCEAMAGRRQADEGDASYRYRRQRNNEAARRSRDKRRRLDGAIRRQLEALVVENRQLRSQLSLCRRLIDELAAMTTFQKDHDVDGRGDDVVQSGWFLSCVSTVSEDQLRRSGVDAASVEELANFEDVTGRRRQRVTDCRDSSACASPLNLSRRHS